MKKKLDRKELWHLYLSLTVVTIFNLYSYLRIFATTIIFLFGRNVFAEFAGNFIAEKFNIFQFASTEMET